MLDLLCRILCFYYTRIWCFCQQGFLSDKKRTGKPKDLAYPNGKQGLKLCNFILGKRQTFLPWKKQFGFAVTRFVLVKMDYPPKGKIDYPFPLSIPPHFLSKKRKEEGIKKEQRKEI